MACDAWKWEKMDQIQEAVNLDGQLKLPALSLFFTSGGGGSNYHGINGLKPHKTAK